MHSFLLILFLRLNPFEHILGLLKVGLLDLILISGLDDLGQPILGHLTVLGEGIAVEELKSEVIGSCKRNGRKCMERNEDEVRYLRRILVEENNDNEELIDWSRDTYALNSPNSLPRSAALAIMMEPSIGLAVTPSP